HAVREALLELRGARCEDAEAELGRADARVLEQPRLPHARGSLDGERPARATRRVAKRGGDPLDLVLALEQRGRPGDGGLSHAQSMVGGVRGPRNVRGSMSGYVPDVRGAVRTEH